MKHKYKRSKKYTAAEYKELALTSTKKITGGICRRFNSICPNGHNYNSKGGYLCPICRAPLKCIGDRWRIGRNK